MFTGGCNDSEPWTYSLTLPNATNATSYIPNGTNITSYIPNGTDITTPPPTLPPSLQNITGLSNFTNYTNTIINYTSPAPSEYLSTLYQPCGIAASNLDSDSCTATSSDTCSGEPELKCRSACGACHDNSSFLFPREPPSCFNGSQTGEYQYSRP